MILYTSKYRSIGEIQMEFSRRYPFLKIEFEHKKNGRALLEKINEKLHEGVIEISDSTTVEDLQKSIRILFGITTRVFRRSGNIWLETTMTDHWTLQQQNQHGKEISA
jgi:predicted house-cleaning noncanonical NTP pyrophosphatase (MazG superfamily)